MKDSQTNDPIQTRSLRGWPPPGRLSGRATDWTYQPLGHRDITLSASPAEEVLVFARGRFSTDSQIYRANADGTDERLLTPNLGGCMRPVFGRNGDRVFFLQQEWPKGPAGEPKFSVWEALLDASNVRMVASYFLFDGPQSWKPDAFPFR